MFHNQGRSPFLQRLRRITKGNQTTKEISCNTPSRGAHLHLSHHSSSQTPPLIVSALDPIRGPTFPSINCQRKKSKPKLLYSKPVREFCFRDQKPQLANNQVYICSKPNGDLTISHVLFRMDLPVKLSSYKCTDNGKQKS